MLNEDLESVLKEQLAPLSRRTFLRRGLGAAAGVAVLCGTWRDAIADEFIAVPSEIRFLSPLEYRVLNKIREVFLHPEVLGMPSTVDIPVMQNIDLMISHVSKPVRANINLAGKIFEFSPGYRLSRFSGMSDEAALAHMEKWQHGYFFQRGLITALKSVVALAYWRDQRVNPYLDYDGPVSVKWGVRKLGNAPMPTDL